MVLGDILGPALTMEGNMKVIEYKNKKLKLPYDLKAGETSTELVTRQNPFSGQSIQLPEFAAVIYDNIIILHYPRLIVKLEAWSL